MLLSNLEDATLLVYLVKEEEGIYRCACSCLPPRHLPCHLGPAQLTLSARLGREWRKAILVPPFNSCLGPDEVTNGAELGAFRAPESSLYSE
jgi:hypothetical protein